MISLSRHVVLCAVAALWFTGCFSLKPASLADLRKGEQLAGIDLNKRFQDKVKALERIGARGPEKVLATRDLVQLSELTGGDLKRIEFFDLGSGLFRRKEGVSAVLVELSQPSTDIDGLAKTLGITLGETF